MATIILAKIFGLYLVIMGIIMLVRVKQFKRMMDDFIANPASLHLARFMALILGIIAVVFHNSWVMNWSVVITILAWLTLAKGVMYLSFPDLVQRMIQKANRPKYYYGASVVSIAIGAFLLYNVLAV